MGVLMALPSMQALTQDDMATYLVHKVEKMPVFPFEAVDASEE